MLSVIEAVFSYSSPFQNAKAMFCRPCVSETPAIPSSPHLNVRERACSCGKSVYFLALINFLSRVHLAYGSKHHRRHCSPRELEDTISSVLLGIWPWKLTRSPLSLRYIRTPFLPILCTLLVFLETLFFFSQILVMVNSNHSGGDSPTSRK